MRYLKMFEETTDEYKYWRINCISLHYLQLSLKKIGINKNDAIYQDIMDTYEGTFIFQDIYFYIGQLYDIWSKELEWIHSTSTKFFRQDRAKYQGQVKVEKWELDASKYNL